MITYGTDIRTLWPNIELHCNFLTNVDPYHTLEHFGKIFVPRPEKSTQGGATPETTALDGSILKLSGITSCELEQRMKIREVFQCKFDSPCALRLTAA